MSVKAIIAKVNVPDKSGIVFTKECLINIAKKNPSRYFFDENEEVLYCISDSDGCSLLSSIRKTIVEELTTLDSKPYSDSIISIQLEMARDIYGKQIKDSLIDEFGLEKYGWNKLDSSENIRRSKR